MVEMHLRIESQHAGQVAEADLAAALVSKENGLAQPCWEAVRPSDHEATVLSRTIGRSPGADLLGNKVLEGRQELPI